MTALSIGDRLRLVGSAVGTALFSRSLATTSSLVTVLNDLLPRGNPPRRGTAEFLEFISRNPLLRQALKTVAEARAAVPWMVVAPSSVRDQGSMDLVRYAGTLEARMRLVAEGVKEGDMRVMRHHPLARLLTANVGPWLPGATCLELSEIHYESVGEWVWLLGRNRGGRGVPVECLPIPPSWVAETPTGGSPFFRFSKRLLAERVPMQDVLYIRDHAPADPYDRGRGAGQAFASELEAAEHAAETSRRIYDGGGPAVLITGRGLEGQREELERRWRKMRRGIRGEGFPAMFLNTPEGLQVHRLDQDLANMRVVEHIEATRRWVRQYWGIPPSLFGDFQDNSGLGRSGVELEEFVFLRRQVRVLEARRMVFQALLEREYDDGLVIVYTNPIREDWEREMKAMQARPQAFQIDEWRRRGGAAPLGQRRGGEGFLVEPGIEIRSELVEQEEEPRPEEPAPPDDTDDEGDTEE